jgi:hypothetical protein
MATVPLTWFVVGLVLGVAVGASAAVLVMLKVKNGAD